MSQGQELLPCCCGAPVCSDLCCASSYATSGITGSYTFHRTNVSRSSCNSCVYRDYSIEISWTQIGPCVISRFPGPSGQCCYKGNGLLSVTYSVTIREHTYNIMGCADVDQTQSYSGVADVPCAITINCGAPITCGGLPTDGLGMTHTLHICDFGVTCGEVYTLAWDCEACTDFNGPYSLWCVGATISYVSNLSCPLQFTPTVSAGYYAGNPGQACFAQPFPAMSYNSGAFGPFAIVTGPFCDDQEQLNCSLSAQSNALIATRPQWVGNLVPEWGVALTESLMGPCGGTDITTGPLPGCTANWYQSSPGSMPWRYF